MYLCHSANRYRVKKASTTHFTTVDAIQAAVYADGSVSASFDVYVACSVTQLPSLTRGAGTATS